MFCDTHKLQLAVDKVSFGSAECMTAYFIMCQLNIMCERSWSYVIVTCHPAVGCAGLWPLKALFDTRYIQDVHQFGCNSPVEIVRTHVSLVNVRYSPVKASNLFGNGCRACFYVHTAQA